MTIDEIEELIYYNLSFNINVIDTLKSIERLDLLYYFSD